MIDIGDIETFRQAIQGIMCRAYRTASRFKFTGIRLRIPHTTSKRMVKNLRL
ncbi:MAG: hypothetical protein J7K96_01045 [Desulfobacteraceae bacterium]|nr:hypothetical protein [Desulfobacteraceae bacterium]